VCSIDQFYLVWERKRREEKGERRGRNPRPSMNHGKKKKKRKKTGGTPENEKEALSLVRNREQKRE